MLQQAFGSRVAMVDHVQDWKDAIRLAVEPLIADGLAEHRYLEGIYNNVAQNGDYFIVAPGFAIPHTRPENGASGTGFSLVKLNQPVIFSSGEPVVLLIALVATVANQHLDMMAELTNLLMEDEIMERLQTAQSVEELKEILA